MRNYAFQRLILVVPTLLAATVLTFIFLRIVPGDAAVAKAGLGATDENVEQFRKELGLDRPYFPLTTSDAFPYARFTSDDQFTDWAGDAMRADFGESTVYGESVRSEIAERIPVTLELVVLATLLTVLIGVPAGIISAVRQNTPVDVLSRTVSVFGLSIPSFFLGTVMLLLPAIWWGWAPPATYVSFWDDPWTNMQMFFLPAIALSAAYVATVMRLTRSAMLDVLHHDFVRTARAKGLRERQMLSRHALKNALIPVITFLGLQVVTMMTGSVVIEQLFNLNGVGKLLFTSIFARDYAMTQGLVLFLATVVLFLNLAVDLCYGWLDPRVRYT
jgi:peptide/nickel transport system permease protein